MSDAVDRDQETRLFLVVQHELPMSDTSLAIAAAQATWLTLRSADPSRLAAYDAHIQPKIALRAKNEGALLRARDEAMAAGLPCALVTVGEGVPAVLGIGPAVRSELPKYVGKLQLLSQKPDADGSPVDTPRLPHDVSMWILVRRDLQITCGKLAAQSGHACWSSGMMSLEQDTDKTEKWEAAGCSVGVLWVDGLDEMKEAHSDALQGALPSAFIVDAGRTEFQGPTPTVVGIGPCSFDELPFSVRKLAGDMSVWCL